MTARIIKLVPRRKVGIWVRVSTEFQAQGDSPEHHEARGREAAAAKDWEVAEVYRLEAVSGKTVIWHPEAQRMLGDVKSGRISGLIVSKFARLVRNTRELLELTEIFQANNADLISLDEPIDIATSSGRLFLTVMSGLAMWEREEIGARVAASVPIRAKLGKPLGGAAPFGYQWKDKKLIVDEKEAPVRRLMYEMFLEHKRKKTVARLLNDAGHRTRNGSKFSDTTVDRLLRDPSAKGLRRANHTCSINNKKAWMRKPESKWVMVPIEPIISEELWAQVNQLLDAQRTKSKRPIRKPVNLFAGLTFCECGGKMYVPSNSPKYVCYSCRNKVIPDVLERLFLAGIKSLFMPDRIGLLFARAEDGLHAKRKLFTDVSNGKIQVRAEMDKLYQAYITDQFDEDDLGRFYRPLKARLQEAEERLAELGSEIAALDYQCSSHTYVVDGVQKIVGEWWPSVPFEARRWMIETFVKKIEVKKKGSVIIWFHLLGQPPKAEGVDFGPLSLICGLEVLISVTEAGLVATDTLRLTVVPTASAA